MSEPDDNDDVRIGEPYEWTGVFTPTTDAFDRWHTALGPVHTGPRTITICIKSRWFGVDWWDAEYHCSLVRFDWTETRSDDGLTMISMQGRSTEPYERVPAVWWRRLGYRYLARPLDWIAWHAWRKFKTAAPDQEPQG